MTPPTSFAGCRSPITCVRIVSPCNAPGLPLARAARIGYAWRRAIFTRVDPSMTSEADNHGVRDDPASGLVKKLREFRGAVRGNRLQITRAADRGTRQDSAAKLSRRAVSVAGDVVENHARSRIEKAVPPGTNRLHAPTLSRTGGKSNSQTDCNRERLRQHRSQLCHPMKMAGCHGSQAPGQKVFGILPLTQHQSRTVARSSQPTAHR